MVYIYKSVTIRDSRQSIELAASLWNVSWIIFIFLLLPFPVGVCGMNVDAFKAYPSLHWYFVAPIPFVSRSISPIPRGLGDGRDTDVACGHILVCVSQSHAVFACIRVC